MLAVIYWTLLSLLVISLSHHLYMNMFEKTPGQDRMDKDDGETEMREELTAYVNSLKK